MSKKILIFTNHFFPERFRINDMATFLDKEGYKVDVVTQLPNYPEGNIYKDFKKKANRNTKYGNVHIQRLWCIPRGKSSLGLVLNYLSYWFSSFLYSLKSNYDYDYIFIYQTSPIFMAKAAQRIGKKNNSKIIHYVLDMWPDNLTATLNIKNAFIKRFLEKMCLKIYLKSDEIIISSKMFEKQLKKIGYHKEVGFLPQHAESVYKRISKPKVNTYLPQDFFNLVFTGNIGEAQGLSFLIDVALKLKELNNKSIHINLVGDGRYLSKLKHLVNMNDLNSYFSFHGSYKMEEMSNILSETDLGLISFSNNLIYQYTVPAKLQSYLACGVPIITYAKGEVNDIVKESKSGVPVEIGDVDKFVSTIIAFSEFSKEELESYKINAVKYFKNNYSEEIVFDNLLKYFKEKKR